MSKSEGGVYSFNSSTAKRNADGAVATMFGGRFEAGAKDMPISNGRNITIRLYLAHEDILGSDWTFPEPHPSEWFRCVGAEFNYMAPRILTLSSSAASKIHMSEPAMPLSENV